MTMSLRQNREAYVTLATTDSYALGALVWGASLRRHAITTRELVVMVPPENDSPQLCSQMRQVLYDFFDFVEVVDLLSYKDECSHKGLILLSRPELAITFTKLYCWRLTQYSKAIFMDADTLVLKNIDELFDCEELSAAPDPGWPDCFNSGVFVFQPSNETFTNLVNFALQFGSFDGGDQGLLNEFYSDWRTSDIRRHLSVTFNCATITRFYTYLPAFVRFLPSIRVLHFIGSTKPWHFRIGYSKLLLDFDSISASSSYQSLVQLWWMVYNLHIKPILPVSLFLTLSRVSCVDAGLTEDSLPDDFDDRIRQYAWERNEIDYLGVDRFDNILKKLKQSMID